MCQFVEVSAAYAFGAHFGEVAFALVGVFFVEEFSHDGAEDGIAEVFEPLVVDFVALAHVERLGFVNEGYLVQLGIAGCATQRVFEEKVKFFVFSFIAAQVKHGLYFAESQCGVVSTEAEGVA